MPRAGTSVGNVRTVSGTGGNLRLDWDGQRVIEEVTEIELEALSRVVQRAKAYWDGQEWTRARHPYMTGDEESIKANGYFIVTPNEQGTISLMYGSDSEHTLFEELGTARQHAHHPIRNTVDKTAYTIADELRRAAQRRGM